ncbi:hypothetical protein [Acetobacter conturbans]|uniref:Uncharacterized protein n=1 Tax=Acetobacter conturbans TaxID=1737472 RepID=A0ABX0K1K3_9PROT|nr:hypothetical protein [Acetobacter conturbans]NHN89612.1 hypothetical protein [Acetobacter conturbans]
MATDEEPPPNEDGIEAFTIPVGRKAILRVVVDCEARKQASVAELH